ncbi:unnamed protein product, partial [Iphiclides podalirius]
MLRFVKGLRSGVGINAGRNTPSVQQQVSLRPAIRPATALRNESRRACSRLERGRRDGAARGASAERHGGRVTGHVVACRRRAARTVNEDRLGGEARRAAWRRRRARSPGRRRRATPPEDKFGANGNRRWAPVINARVGIENQPDQTAPDSGDWRKTTHATVPP